MSATLHRLGFKAISGLCGVLPRRVLYALSRPISRLYYMLHSEARKNVQSNLRGLLGPDASASLVRREARGVFRSFGYYLCEFFSSAHWDAKFFDSHCIINGREHVEAALKNGRGAIFCPGHYSSWELGAMLVAHMGVPITAVVQAHADPENHELFVKQRAAKGIHVVSSQHGAKGALRALRSNQTVALMGDRSTGGPQVPVTFFGKTAWLPQGPWRIALISGAALLPTFIVRRPNYNFTLDIGAPIPHPQDGTLQERMRVLAQAWTSCFEARLRADPSQWAAFNDVWAAPNGAVAVEADSIQQESPGKIQAGTKTGTLHD